MKSNFKKGFTLMELLIVMVILGILTTIVASSFKSSQQKARDTRRKSNLQAVSKALELYFSDKGQYPASDANGDLVVSDCESASCTWGEGFVDDNETVYMIKLPEEKTSARNYYYHAELDGATSTYKSYVLLARLENDLDKDIPYNEAEERYQFYTGTTGSSCGASFTGCNYAISSTNISPEDIFPLSNESY